MKSEQEQVGRFVEFIGASHPAQVRKFQEEVTEAILTDDKTSKPYAMELTDVIIVSLGLIHCMGLDFQQLFDEKMKLNWEKYKEVRGLKKMGFSHEEAVQVIRRYWNEGKQGSL